MGLEAIEELEREFRDIEHAVRRAEFAIIDAAQALHKEYHGDSMYAADWKRCFHPACSKLTEAYFMLDRI